MRRNGRPANDIKNRLAGGGLASGWAARRLIRAVRLTWQQRFCSSAFGSLTLWSSRCRGAAGNHRESSDRSEGCLDKIGLSRLPLQPATAAANLWVALERFHFFAQLFGRHTEIALELPIFIDVIEDR